MRTFLLTLSLVVGSTIYDDTHESYSKSMYIFPFVSVLLSVRLGTYLE